MLTTARIERAVAVHAESLKPAVAALHAYAEAYHNALRHGQPTVQHLKELDRHADEWDRLRPQAMRHCAAAVASMKSAGLWTDDLDALIDQHITANLAEAGIADDEIVRLRAYLAAGTT